MSVFAIEKMLWQTTNNPAEAESFRDNPEAHLKNFRVDEEERALLTAWDVAALADRGVNPMVLLMAFSAVKGNSGMFEYLMKINQPREAAPTR